MPHSLRFGVITIQNALWPVLVERWHYIEELGFDSLWVADHYLNSRAPGQPWFDGWTLLAALATHTQRIRLGTLVTNIPMHNPAMLARQALTVDHISGGRLELGLGSGLPGDVGYRMIGVEDLAPPERVGHFREAVEIIDSLLRNETTTYEGRYYNIREAIVNPRPLQHPRPPLTLAALGSSMLQITARYADTWNTFPGRGLSAQEAVDLTRQRNETLSELCDKIGRNPEEIRRALLLYGAATGVNPFASPAAFEDYIGPYLEVGITDFIVYYPPDEWYPPAEGDQRQVFEQVAREVIPRLRREVEKPAAKG